jgi:hypothetical protein
MTPFGNPGAYLVADPRQKMAEQLLTQGSSTAPIQHWMQGLARLGQAAAGAYMQRNADRDKQEAQKAMMAGMSAQPWVNPDTGKVAENQNATGGYAGALAALQGQAAGGNYTAGQMAGPMAMQLAQYQMTQAQKEQDRKTRLADLLAVKAAPGWQAPKQPVPGRDIPLPRDVAAQRERMALNSRPVTNVKMPAQETEFDKAMGKEMAAQYISLQSAAKDATSRLSKMQQIDRLLGDQGGAGAETGLAIKKAAAAIGVQLDLPENIGRAEAAQALANELALQLRNPAGGAGMPGAMSDSDRSFLASMTPGLSQTPEGRKMLIEATKRIAKRNQEVARHARDYARKNGGRIDVNFETSLQNAFGNKSLFDDMVPGNAIPVNSPGGPASGDGGFLSPAAQKWRAQNPPPR